MWCNVVVCMEMSMQLSQGIGQACYICLTCMLMDCLKFGSMLAWLNDNMYLLGEWLMVSRLGVASCLVWFGLVWIWNVWYVMNEMQKKNCVWYMLSDA